MSRNQVFPLLNEAHELTSIFVKTRKTAQKKIYKSPIDNQQSSIENYQSRGNQQSTIDNRK